MEGKKQDHRSHPRARTYGEMSEADELSLVVSSQRRELMAATATESDLELAFHLQMEEAMAASLALPSSSSSSSSSGAAASSSISPSPTAAIATTEPEKDDEGITHLIKLQSLELDRYNLEMNDLEMSRAMTRQAVDDISRRALDERFALEILEMPEDEWEEYGDLFDRPIDAARTAEEPNFRLYFKGMATEEFVKGSSVKVAAIAIAVCDLCGNLILKVEKPVPYSAVGTCRLVLEATALVEGLNAVISLGIKRLDVFCDYRTLCNYVRGIWNNKRNKIADVINQVLLLQRKFERCGIFLVPRCHIKFVFKLAREAIDSQLPKNIVDLRITGETCNICLEITDSSEMFAVNSCSHRFCCSCLQQHVEVKLLNGVLPGCPHDGCKVVLALEDARKFLPPKLLEIMISRLKEASIPVNEKVYCPYPRCSALMSIHEAKFPQQESSSKKFIFNASGLRKCIKCNGSFCINCKVPWHENLLCSEFKRSNPHPHSEEVKLRSLAKAKLWRQCIKCNHMIELLEGCFHMTCRCGYEFCYTCGLEYKNKSPACKCPLFAYSSADEDSDFDEEDDDFDDEDEPYYSDYDDYSAYRPF